MKKVINRAKLNNKEYVKILNIVDNKIVYINIFIKKEKDYLEVLPGDIDIKIGKQILDPKNDISMNKDELMEFCNYLDNVREKCKENFKKMLMEKRLTNAHIKLAKNTAGVEYAMVQDKNLPYAEIIRLHFDENGNVRATGVIPMSHIDLIVMDIIPLINLNLLKGQRLIQVENDTFYGVRQDKDIVVVSHMNIRGEDLNKTVSCIKAYALKKVEDTYSLYSYDEVTDDFEKRVKNNVKMIMDHFVNEMGVQI